jgi:hypothetical protein
MLLLLPHSPCYFCTLEDFVTSCYPFPLVIVKAGNTKGGSITVLLTSCLTSLESAVCQLIIVVFICKTDKSKPVKQEVNSTVILTPLVYPGES